MRHAMLLMMVLSPVGAQSAPDVATLLKRSDHALESHPTFRYEWRSASKGDGPEGPRFRTSFETGSAFGRNDGKWRIESNYGRTLINDGNVTWTYDDRGNTYDSGDFLPLGLRLGVLFQAGVADVTMLYQYPVGEVREEKIDVDGKARDCWVVTTASAPQWNLQATTWIDKELWIDWKVVTKQHMTVPEKFDLEITIEKSNLAFDPVLPDSLFVFAPPPGSKQFCCRDEIRVH